MTDKSRTIEAGNAVRMVSPRGKRYAAESQHKAALSFPAAPHKVAASDVTEEAVP